MSASLLDELLVGLGFEYDPKDLDKYEEALDSTVNLVKKLAKVSIAGAAAIGAITSTSALASDEQGKLANEIGETVENLSALSFALGRAGGNSDSMGSSLQQLSIRASEAMRGMGAGVEAFGLLGISVTDANGDIKTTSDLLIEVSKEFQGLSKQRQTELADKLGIRDSLRLLQKGPKAIRELTAEAEALGVATEEDAELGADFADSLANITRIGTHMARLLTRHLLPATIKLNNMFVEWWKSNRQLIETNLPDWLDKAGKALKILVLGAGLFVASKILVTMSMFVSLLKVASVSAILLNGLMLALPVIISALAIAIGLLAEDAHGFFEGQESFIGDMLEKYPKWKTQILSIASVFATIADVTSKIFDGWSQIIDLFTNGSALQFIKDLPGFIGDSLGFNTIDDRLANDIAQQNTTNSNSQRIEKIEINVDGGGGNPQAIAQATFDLFQQTAQELNTAVDQ